MNYTIKMQYCEFFIIKLLNEVFFSKFKKQL